MATLKDRSKKPAVIERGERLRTVQMRMVFTFGLSALKDIHGVLLINYDKRSCVKKKRQMLRERFKRRLASGPLQHTWPIVVQSGVHLPDCVFQKVINIVREVVRVVIHLASSLKYTKASFSCSLSPVVSFSLETP